jgi:hypothetical protein
MNNQNYARTIAALEKMISEMQYLVEHPRMQQRNWVAKGRAWLPLLRHAIEDLSKQPEAAKEGTEMTQNLNRNETMLIKVNVSGGETYVHINLDDVAQVTVARKGEPGYYVPRGAHSGFELKNGQKYLTNADEAQNIVNALRNDESKPT